MMTFPVIDMATVLKMGMNIPTGMSRALAM
jgi:hypothetical protein